MTPDTGSHATLSVHPDEDDEVWEEFLNEDANTQTSDPNDHINRLMEHCRQAMDSNRSSGPIYNAEEHSTYHVLANGESIVRCTETLHLPGGGFYSRFY